MAAEATLAVGALAAWRRRRHRHPLTDRKAGDEIADLVHHPDRFVAEDGSVSGGELTAQTRGVCGAERGEGGADDHLVCGSSGDWALFDSRASLTQNESLHGHDCGAHAHRRAIHAEPNGRTSRSATTAASTARDDGHVRPAAIPSRGRSAAPDTARSTSSLKTSHPPPASPLSTATRDKVRASACSCIGGSPK